MVDLHDIRDTLPGVQDTRTPFSLADAIAPDLPAKQDEPGMTA